jgi:hypothetical protein
MLEEGQKKAQAAADLSKELAGKTLSYGGEDCMVTVICSDVQL